MFTLSTSHRIHVLFLNEWGGEYLSVDKVNKTDKPSITLTEVQQQIVNRILAQLEVNPDIQETLKNDFADMFQTVAHDPKMLDAMIQNAQTHMIDAINAIKKMDPDLEDPADVDQIKSIIHRYTDIELATLRASIPSQTPSYSA